MAFCGHADVMLDRGALAQAANRYESALESFLVQDDHWGVALARLGLGRVFARGGRFPEAARELTKAVDGFGALHDYAYQATALRALADLHAG